jgi:uncharacterized protein YkwD
MKNLRKITSKSTLLLVAASAVFMFTGCNSGVSDMANTHSGSDASGAPVVNSVKNNNTTPASTPTPESKKDEKAATEVLSTVSDAQRQDYLDAMNAARAEVQDCGTEGVFDPAPALTWNNMLDNAAYEHSNDLAESNTFSHTGSGTASDITSIEDKLSRGSKFYERIKHHGYTQYRTVGENIAAGYETAQEVVEAWIESDHHCANLMSPKYTEVGMVLVKKTGSEYGFYWSQEFGGK